MLLLISHKADLSSSYLSEEKKDIFMFYGYIRLTRKLDIWMFFG